MTYLVAVKRGDETCLIADTFATFGGQSQPGALKTGFLFAGCAYGIAGSAEGGRRFIVDFKKTLTREYPVEESWRMFVDYQQHYQYPAGGGFELLLLSRCSGETQIWTFSPSGGLIQREEELVSLGSGKGWLDAGLALDVLANHESCQMGQRADRLCGVTS